MKSDKPVTIYNARLPDALEERAAAIREAQYLSDFEKGDLANDVYRWALATGIQCSIQSACARVAMMLDGAGQGAFRIYDLAQLAMTYKTQRLRKRYAILPISHLEYAAGFPRSERDRILERDLRLLDANFGRPVSLNKLKVAWDPLGHRSGDPTPREPEHFASPADFGQAHDGPGEPGTDQQPDLIPAVDDETYSQLESITRQLRLIDTHMTHAAPGAVKLLKPIIMAMIEFTAALSRARRGEAIPVDVEQQMMDGVQHGFR